MDWFKGKIYRKPSIFPLSMGFSCNFSLKPIHCHKHPIIGDDWMMIDDDWMISLILFVGHWGSHLMT